MKRNIIVAFIALFTFALSAKAQHVVQVDDGAGHIGLLTGAGLIAPVTFFAFPSSSGTLITNAAGQINLLLPGQGGNAGKFLQTDGTNVSWVTGGTVSNSALQMRMV